MSIQDLGSIGEFISAIAVLITLLYLAIQVRAIRSANLSDFTAHTIQFRTQLNALEIEHASLLMKAQDGDELSKEEEFILNRIFQNQASFYFHQFIRVRESDSKGVWFKVIRPFCGLLESNTFYLRLFEGRLYEKDPDSNVVEFMSLVHSELKSRRDA